MAGQPRSRQKYEKRAMLALLPKGGTNIPLPVWQAMTPVEQLTALYRGSLDFCRVALLEWPYDPNDVCTLTVQDRIRHDVMNIVAKAGVESMREAQNTDKLDELIKAFEAQKGKKDIEA